MLVFSYEVNKPKAVGPLVTLGAQIIGGIIIGEMAEMGIKWGSKAIVKKQADNFAEMAINEKNIYGYDFMRTNPYRNKDGSLAIHPSTNDYAKLGGVVAGTLGGLMIDPFLDNPDLTYEDLACEPDYSHVAGKTAIGFEIKKKTGSDGLPEPVLDNLEDFQYALMYISAYSEPSPAGGYKISFYNKITGVELFSSDRSSISGYKAVYEEPLFQLQKHIPGSGWSRVNFVSDHYSKIAVSSALESNITLAKSKGHDIFGCNGLVVPETLKNVYVPPLDLDPNFQMPNHEKFQDRPIIINNVFPAGEEGEVSWEDLPTDFGDKYEVNIDQYIARGDINNNPLTVEELENRYTDIDIPIKKDEVDYPTIPFPTSPDSELPVPVPDGGDLTPVDPIDRSILQVMKESYAYLADSIDTAIEAMKNITDGATGIVNYLDQAFRWLPPEWRALFGAAFILGVFAHFFRR